MPLPVPNLDDRVFQDLVNEARSRIPLYCPEWTDHNLSDPGITLIELFAWMMELVIYRLNKVPDKNYVKFLELIGIRLAPGSPASTDITLRLAAPQETAITIPMGTEIATVRTETQDAVVFTTDEDLTITPPELEHFLLSRDGDQFDDHLPTMREWEGSAAGTVPAQGDGVGSLAFSILSGSTPPVAGRKLVTVSIKGMEDFKTERVPLPTLPMGPPPWR